MSHVDLVLVRAGREVSLGRVVAGERCDLRFIDDLLQLQLVVHRFGWSLRLDAVPGELQELVDLVGLGNQLNTGPTGAA